MLSRRGFLIGTGGLLTMAFVSDARAFIRRKEAPLLATPRRTPDTLWWDWPDGLDEPQLFLDGEPEVIAPQPPTWRVFLKSLDAKDYTASGIKLRLEQIGLNQVNSTRKWMSRGGKCTTTAYLDPPRRRLACSKGSTLAQTSAGRATALISSSGRAAAISSIIRSTRMRATCSRSLSCRHG